MRLFDGTLRVETIRGRKGPFNVGKLMTDIGEFKVKDKELDQFEPGDYTGNFQIEKIYTTSNPWRGGFFTEIIAKIAEGGFLIDQEDAPVAPAGEAQAEPDPIDAERQNERHSAPTAPALPVAGGGGTVSVPESAPLVSRKESRPGTVEPLVAALVDLNSRIRDGMEFPDACMQVLKVHQVNLDALRGAYDAQYQEPKADKAFDDVDLKLFGLEIHALFLSGDDIALDPTVDREQFRRQRDRLKDSGYRFNAQSQVWRK